MSSSSSAFDQAQKVEIHPDSRIEAPMPNPASDPIKRRGFIICLSIAEDRSKLDKFFTANFSTQEIFDILQFAIRNGSQQQCMSILRYIATKKISFEEPGDQHAALIPDAINKGYRDLAINLIKTLPNIAEIKDINGNCAIHYATYYQDLTLIEALVDVKANFNTPNAAGLSPLCIAIEAGNLVLFNYLISRGANVDSPHNISPLEVACTIKDRENFVESLLCNGAIINAENAAGKTPYMVASKNNNNKSKKIIAAVSNITRDLLYSKSHEEISSSFNREFKGYYAPSPQMLKCKFLTKSQGITQSPITLLQAFNAKKQKGETLMHHAVINGHRELSQFMVSAKLVKPNMFNGSGLTPAMEAAISSQREIYEHLIREVGIETQLESGQSFVNFIFSKFSAEEINNIIAIITGGNLSKCDGFISFRGDAPYLDPVAIKSKFEEPQLFKRFLAESPHESFSEFICPDLKILDLNKRNLIREEVLRGLGIDIMDIAGYDNLYDHEALDQPGNEKYKRAIQEEFLSEIVFSRGDPKILRIALYMGLDITEKVYAKTTDGKMSYQDPEDRAFEQKNLPMINELFSFFATCGSTNNRVFNRCKEFYRVNKIEPPLISSLPSLYQSLNKENRPASKRPRLEPQPTTANAVDGPAARRLSGLRA